MFFSRRDNACREHLLQGIAGYPKLLWSFRTSFSTHSRMLLRGRELSAAPAIIPIAARIALGQVLGFAIKKVDKLLSAPTTLIQQLPGNAFFVSTLDGKWLNYNGQVLAAYYHPTCVHRASTKGKLDLKRSVAAKGKWAVSFQTRGLFGNKSNYLACCGKTQKQCHKA